MGILKRVFKSIAGKADESGKSGELAEPLSTRQRERVSPPNEHPLSSSPLEGSLPSMVESAGEAARPPSIIFQPILDPVQEDSHVLDEVIHALDHVFDAGSSLNSESDVPAAISSTDEQSDASVQELFSQIAANYLVPLKNFMFELHRGTASKDQIDMCRAVLKQVWSSIEIMGLPEAAQKMSDFDEVLTRALTNADELLKGEIRRQILISYDDLVQIMPEAFQLGDKLHKREEIIIKSLLGQIPGFGCVSLEKLYRAGLGTLETLFLANQEDLAVATGIPPRLCELICIKVTQHRKELESKSHRAAHSAWYPRLTELVSALRHENEITMALTRPKGSLIWEKQNCRDKRKWCFLEIAVVLAEMGELDLYNRTRKCSYKRRIEILDEYLALPNGTASEVSH